MSNVRKVFTFRYRHQTKSWIDGIPFKEWVRELDRTFPLEGGSVAQVMDNYPTHPHIENLKSIKLFFLPPNTTSITQPMDQGAIRSLKTKYRKNMVQTIIRSLEENNALSEVSILKAIQMLVSA